MILQCDFQAIWELNFMDFWTLRPLKILQNAWEVLQKSINLSFNIRSWKWLEKVPQIASKMDPKSAKISTKTCLRNTSKIYHKINIENYDFGVQMGWFFERFLRPKSTPKQPWNQLGTQIEKTPENDPKNYSKITTFNDFLWIPSKPHPQNNQDT